MSKHSLGALVGNVKKLIKNKDPRLLIYGIFALLLILTILVRVGMINYKTDDYTSFSSWYDFVKAHGLHSFKYTFSNYNPPYTYFLYIATLLPISKIVAIKSILIFFDFIQAASIYLIVKHFKPTNYMPEIAAITSMFLPTVILNGVAWSQFDQFYTAFILFSLYAGLKNKSKTSWALYGVAIAIKLQAIFFAPVIIAMSLKRIKWFDAFWGGVVFCVLTFPPVLIGRSFSSIIDIYKQQTNLFSGMLSLNAPSMWQWFPSQDFKYFNDPAIYLTGAAVLLFILITFIYKKFSDKEILIATSLMLYLVPFLLPQMHDRYFFPAGIGSFVLAFIMPELAWLAVLMQVVTIFVYTPFLLGTVVVPMSALSIVIVGMVYFLGAAYLKQNKPFTLSKLQPKAKVSTKKA